MAYTNNERINAINALLEEREEVDSLISKAKWKVTEIRHDFADKVDLLPDINTFSRETIALFWKGEVKLHLSDSTSSKIKACLKKASTSNVSTARWTAATRSQIEQDLWTLWINQRASGGSSLDEKMISDCFDALERHQSSLLCLMRWLFRETKERLNAVETILTCRDLSASFVRDRMLFWIAYMRDADYGQEVKDITARIRDLQLRSGAFAATEEGDQNGDLISSAIGLLALISCARENGYENLAIGAVRQTVRWIIGHITDAIDEGVAWGYYALCEYIDLESTTKER